MKIIAILGIIGLIGWFALEVDEKTFWMSKVKRWFRSKLGLCNHFRAIRFEEEYSKEGEPFYHHTYRITYCKECGKIFRREQLQ